MAVSLALIHLGLFLILLGNLAYLRRRSKATSVSNPPFISILIPARNEERNLQRLLPSLLRQRYPNFEIIVYDDGSQDDTWAVLQNHADPRLRPLRGAGPPPGWVGKVHALYQATRVAKGSYYLFLDADARLEDDQALARLVGQFQALPPASILTGFPRLRGGGLLLVSLVPNVMLCGLPWPLVRRVRTPSLGALNGQCWMLPAETYHAHEPHRHLPGEVLEDVQIGRYLKARGLTPVLVDVQREVSIFMYDSFQDAWQGFRKNAYLLMGGHPLPFAFFFCYYLLTFVLAPLFAPALLFSLYLLKGTTDRKAHFPWWVTLLAPLTLALGSLLHLDSAFSHWSGRVAWKGRRVSNRHLGSDPSHERP